MTATVTLSDPASGQIARLPLSAVIDEGKGPALFVVDRKTGSLEHKPVEVVGYEARDVLVKSGVADGEWIVAWALRNSIRHRRCEWSKAAVLTLRRNRRQIRIRASERGWTGTSGSPREIILSHGKQPATNKLCARFSEDRNMGHFNLSAWAVRHPPLVLFLILMLAVAGTYSYLKLGRAEDPNFTIKVAVVTTIWPGATAQEMQDQVADPIEKKLQELPYFNKVTTYTKPSFTAMQVEFRDSTPPAEVPQLFYQLRKKLGDIRSDLPSDVIGPNVNDEYGDVDSILYMLTADSGDYAQMKRVAEMMRQKLLKVENVTKVNLYGVQDEKIFVEFSHAKLATLGISPQAIFASLAKQNAVTPAGTVETSAQRVALRVTGAVDGAKAVADTPVEFGGSSFRLGDIATVTRGYEDPPSYLVHQRGKPALGIGIVMAKGANILDLGEDIDAAVKQIEATLPQGFDLEKIADQPHVVDHAVHEFTKSFAEALGIVLLVSFISLGWRTGIVVALSVPLVLAITFIVMSMIGLDLQRITLGALIIALGLLVDDAIIAVEMMVVKMEQGWDRERAASFAWTSTAFPMLTGTLVTAAGFLPVGFANSAVGEYAGGIFWVVAIALMASWFVAVVFTPYLGVKLLPDFTKIAATHHDPHEIYETRFYRALRRVIDWCVRHRVIVVLTTIGVFAAAVVGFGRVQQQFFPLSERPELFFQMRLPEGTSIGVTAETARKAEKMVEGDKDVTTYTTYIGQGSPRFWLGLNPQLPNEAFAEIVIVSQDVEARERIKARLENALAQAPCRRRACASTASISGRRSAFRCSFASSALMRWRCAASPTTCARSCARTRMPLIRISTGTSACLLSDSISTRTVHARSA